MFLLSKAIGFSKFSIKCNAIKVLKRLSPEIHCIIAIADWLIAGVESAQWLCGIPKLGDHVAAGHVEGFRVDPVVAALVGDGWGHPGYSTGHVYEGVSRVGSVFGHDVLVAVALAASGDEDDEDDDDGCEDDSGHNHNYVQYRRVRGTDLEFRKITIK